MNMIERLQRPTGRVDVVLDTDTYNEIDDQYALSYLLLSPEQVNVKAIYAAPFYDRDRSFWNFKSESAGDGMERSYQEIQKILPLVGREDLKQRVFRGADRFLPDALHPADSPAARDLADRAMTYTPENPLYVIGIAAPTNIASALLMAPEIADRIVIVWLGGNTYGWPNCREFNLSQDIYASRVLFDSQAALVQVPCMGVASAFTTTPMELTHFLKGKNRLSEYLLDVTFASQGDHEEGRCWSRPIWDVTACAWFMGEGFVLDRYEHRPCPGLDGMYEVSHCRPMLKYVYYINRDKVLTDLVQKLAAVTDD